MLDGLHFSFDEFSAFIDCHPHIAQLHIGWFHRQHNEPEPDWGTLSPSSLPRLSSFSIANIDQDKVMPLLVGRPLADLQGFCLQSATGDQPEVMDSWNVLRFCDALASSKAGVRRLSFGVWDSYMLGLPWLAEAVGSTLVYLNIDSRDLGVSNCFGYR